MELNIYMPTKVIMGKDCIRRNESMLKEMGKKVMIVTGASSARSNGSLADVEETLDSAGIPYVIFDRVRSNPTTGCVYEGAELAKRHNVDFIIGIGGGSPMDAAKAIALLAVQEVTEEELFAGRYRREALPIILIPTTAGTGSEVTPYSILTNEKAQTKTSISSPVLFPKIAFLDAAYMKELPVATTIHTALDALSHAVEGMLSVRATELTDLIAQESIRTIYGCLKELTDWREGKGDGLPLSIREKLLYGSMLAGIVISHTGTTAVHSMGYSLTYFKNVDHGRANALILPSFLEFIAKRDAAVVKNILTAMNLDHMDEFNSLFRRLLGDREQLSEEEILHFADIAIKAKNILNSRVVPTKEDLVLLYRQSR